MGRPRKVGDDEILAVLEETADPSVRRALTTGAVADEVELGRDQTRNRLTDLAADGYVDRERYTDTIIWWITDDGLAYLDELEG